MCATGGDRPPPGAGGAPLNAPAAPMGGSATVPLCMGTVVPRTGSPGVLSRATLDTSTACLGAVLLFDAGLLVSITAGTPGAGDDVAVAGPAPPLPMARPTVCPVGTRDRSRLCQVVVGAGETLVRWLAAPGEETPAPSPAWGLPRVARPPGRTATLGGSPCSPLVLAGTSVLAVTCGTRLPAEQDKADPAGSTPPWPQQAGTCPRPAACQPYLSRGCPQRWRFCRQERGAPAGWPWWWGTLGTCPGPEAAWDRCCRPQGRCCPALLGLAWGKGAAPPSPLLVLAAEQEGEGRMRKKKSPRSPSPPSVGGRCPQPLGLVPTPAPTAGPTREQGRHLPHGRESLFDPEPPPFPRRSWGTMPKLCHQQAETGQTPAGHSGSNFQRLSSRTIVRSLSPIARHPDGIGHLVSPAAVRATPALTWQHPEPPQHPAPEQPLTPAPHGASSAAGTGLQLSPFQGNDATGWLHR